MAKTPWQHNRSLKTLWAVLPAQPRHFKETIHAFWDVHCNIVTEYKQVGVTDHESSAAKYTTMAMDVEMLAIVNQEEGRRRRRLDDDDSLRRMDWSKGATCCCLSSAEEREKASVSSTRNSIILYIPCWLWRTRSFRRFWIHNKQQTTAGTVCCCFAAVDHDHDSHPIILDERGVARQQQEEERSITMIFNNQGCRLPQMMMGCCLSWK